MPRTTTPRTKKMRGHEETSGRARLPDLPAEPAAAADPRQRPFPAYHLPALRGARKVRAGAGRGRWRGSQHILLVAQRQVATEDPEPDDLHEIGIVAEIMQILKVPDGTVRVMLEGMERARVVEYHADGAVFSGRDRAAAGCRRRTAWKAEALMRSVIDAVRADRQHRQEHPAGSRRDAAQHRRTGRPGRSMSPGICRPCASKPSRRFWKRWTRRSACKNSACC